MKTKKIDYNHSKFTILTNRCDYENDFSYDEYEEFCEDMNIQPDKEKFNSWCEEQTCFNYENDFCYIKEHTPYNILVVLEGNVGAWDGTHKIVPLVLNSVCDAIERCIPNCDHYIDVEFDNGYINVIISHHDGTNVFTIRPKDKRKKFKYLYL